MQGKTKPGQILISPCVLMAVEDAVTVEPVGEFALKGIRRPLAASPPNPQIEALARRLMFAWCGEEWSLTQGVAGPSLSQSDRIFRQALFPRRHSSTVINPGAAFGMIRQTCVRTARTERVAPAKGASPHQLWTAFKNDAQIVSWH